jgi:hypothetical protein
MVLESKNKLKTHQRLVHQTVAIVDYADCKVELQKQKEGWICYCSQFEQGHNYADVANLRHHLKDHKVTYKVSSHPTVRVIALKHCTAQGLPGNGGTVKASKAAATGSSRERNAQTTSPVVKAGSPMSVDLAEADAVGTEENPIELESSDEGDAISLNRTPPPALGQEPFDHHPLLRQYSIARERAPQPARVSRVRCWCPPFLCVQPHQRQP